MTIYSAKTLRFLPVTTTLSLLLLLVYRSFAIDVTPPPPPPPPSVVVTTNDPGDPDPGDTRSCGVSAQIKNPPDPGKEATLIPHWSWAVGPVTVTPYDGGSDVTADAGDFSVSLNPIHDPGKPDDGMIDDSNPAATFTGTFRLTGYYAVPVIATVTYYYKDSGKYYGTYSGQDFVGDSQDNPAYDPANDTSGTSATAPAMTSSSAGQPQAPADAPAPKTPPLPKRAAAGILVAMPKDILKLGLGSKNVSTLSFYVGVKPKAAAGKVSFSVNSGEAGVNASAEYTTDKTGNHILTGNVFVKLTALSATPKTASRSMGDALLIAQAGKNRYTSNVLVLAAADISPHPAPFAKTINGINYSVNEDTQASQGPPTPNVPRTLKALVTVYATAQTLQVVDQFGSPLDPIFAGTPVSETITYQDITSQKQLTRDFQVGVLTASGTYVDTYVGVVDTVKVVDASDPEAGSWPTEAAGPITSSSTVGVAPPVKIGGQTLSPGLQGRTATILPPTPPSALPELDIDWR